MSCGVERALGVTNKYEVIGSTGDQVVGFKNQEPRFNFFPKGCHEISKRYRADVEGTIRMLIPLNDA